MRPTFTSLMLAFVLLAATILPQGCSDKCQVKRKYDYYEPVYTGFAELRASVSMKPAQTISSVGKIYIKGDILFVNEPALGIHVFNNHDRTNPKPIGFLNLPGNYDLAVQDNTLYADSYYDLVVLDISNPANIQEINRLPGFFVPNNSTLFSADPEKGVVTSWNKKEDVTVMKSECEMQLQYRGGALYDGGIAMFSGAPAPTANSNSTSSGGASGIGGSTQRFTILDHMLYALDGYSLNVVDITHSTDPVKKMNVGLNWDAETLFPYKQNIFVGTRAGMYIFDASTPGQLDLVSQYEHIYSCDPVAVDDHYAYVTLWDGSGCHMGTNQLEIISLDDLKNPTLAATYQMTNPHGVGIDNGTLFICDGTDGLKVYDAANPLSIKLLTHYGNISSQDIIPFQKVAIMSSADGIYQYDYSDLKNIRVLSKISVDANQ
jgi:hypothetical protein